MRLIFFTVLFLSTALFAQIPLNTTNGAQPWDSESLSYLNDNKLSNDRLLVFFKCPKTLTNKFRKTLKSVLKQERSDAGHPIENIDADFSNLVKASKLSDQSSIYFFTQMNPKYFFKALRTHPEVQGNLSWKQLTKLNLVSPLKDFEKLSSDLVDMLNSEGDSNLVPTIEISIVLTKVSTIHEQLEIKNNFISQNKEIMEVIDSTSRVLLVKINRSFLTSEFVGNEIIDGITTR